MGAKARLERARQRMAEEQETAGTVLLPNTADKWGSSWRGSRIEYILFHFLRPKNIRKNY